MTAVPQMQKNMVTIPRSNALPDCLSAIKSSPLLNKIVGVVISRNNKNKRIYKFISKQNIAEHTIILWLSIEKCFEKNRVDLNPTNHSIKISSQAQVRRQKVSLAYGTTKFAFSCNEDRSIKSYLTRSEKTHHTIYTCKLPAANTFAELNIPDAFADAASKTGDNWKINKTGTNVHHANFRHERKV